MATDLDIDVWAYGGAKIPISGVIENAPILQGELSHVGRVLVTRDDCKPILGIHFLPHLGCIAIEHCAPINCLDNHFAASFRLRSDAPTDSMRFSARPLPFSMRLMPEAELPGCHLPRRKSYNFSTGRASSQTDWRF